MGGMGKAGTNDAAQGMALGKNSQTARLKKIVGDTKFSLITGVLMRVLLLISILIFAAASKQQTDCVTYLNQYRLGSKALTSAVRSYAVTGDRQYYDAYMRELETDRNRDAALDALSSGGLTDAEWKTLNEIAALSDGLVPLEESAMASVDEGDLEKALDYVFGEEYKDTVQTINDLTDSLITETQDRLKGRKDLALALQLVCAALFLLGFIRMALQCLRTIGFAERELLAPIIKVSEQMEALAAGNLHTELSLAQDDSEVGRMARDIAAMKDGHAAMIEEIAFVLEQMGLGNYQVRIEQEYVGEYRRIRRSLEQIIAAMKDTILEISMAAGEVDSGAGQLAKAAEDLAESCTAQACQVSDAVMLISGLYESISYNEKEAQEAVKISNLAGSTLESPDISMDEIKMGFDETAARIQGIVERFGEDVESVSKISDGINAIAGLVDINSATSDETAAIGEDLKQQVEALVNLMRRFQV